MTLYNVVPGVHVSTCEASCYQQPVVNAAEMSEPPESSRKLKVGGHSIRSQLSSPHFLALRQEQRHQRGKCGAILPNLLHRASPIGITTTRSDGCFESIEAVCRNGHSQLSSALLRDARRCFPAFVWCCGQQTAVITKAKNLRLESGAVPGFRVVSSCARVSVFRRQVGIDWSRRF